MIRYLAGVLLIFAISTGAAQEVPDPHAQEQQLRYAVTRFLSIWYLKRDLSGLMQYVAKKDDVFDFPAVREEINFDKKSNPWEQTFSGAFTAPKAEIEQSNDLKGVIQFNLPTVPGEKPLHFRNAEQGRPPSDPFAIAAPDDLPPGSFFPLKRENVSQAEWEKYDGVAKYLDMIRQRYKGHVYVVLYATKGRSMVQEGVVLYWILENNSWKLAMFQGTD